MLTVNAAVKKLNFIARVRGSEWRALVILDVGLMCISPSVNSLLAAQEHSPAPLCLAACSNYV